MELQTKQAVQKFLQKYGMDPAGVDIPRGIETFINEMKQGLDGAGGSLKMIPTYINAGNEVPVGESVIAIDAGGTNFRVCVVRFDSDRQPVIEDFKMFAMPGTKGRIGKEAFFNEIAEYLAPMLDKAAKIGFCFSYPTEIMPNGDGRLIRFCKEVQVDGVEGELVGKSLLEAIARRGGSQDKKIVLLNDTVATLLGGKAARANRKYGSYIGFILGTGTNTCYIEGNSAITKLPGINLSGNMIINIESGAYDKAPQGSVDKAYDAETTNPGEHKFEKMISGGYFGDVVLAALKQAAVDGLLTGACAQGIRAITKLGTKDVNDFLDNPHGNQVLAQCLGTEDNVQSAANRTAVYYIIDSLYERAARFVAINLIAVVKKSGEGQDPINPVCITAEGTMFHKSRLFREKLDVHMKHYMVDEMGLYCEFIEVDNATLLGTAIAGLTGCAQ